jgi:hypothetical protein
MLPAEGRYEEALRLLQWWPEGPGLLAAGQEYGVPIVSGIFEREPTAIASYSTARRQIQMNPRYLNTPAWMVAAILSHELQHIADSHRGLNQSHESTACFERETRAYAAEARFVQWLQTDASGERVPVAELRKRATGEGRSLSTLLMRIAEAPDVAELVRQDYAQNCITQP